MDIPMLGRPLLVDGNTLNYDRPLIVTRDNVDQYSGEWISRRFNPSRDFNRNLSVSAEESRDDQLKQIEAETAKSITLRNCGIVLTTGGFFAMLLGAFSALDPVDSDADTTAPTVLFYCGGAVAYVGAEFWRSEVRGIRE
jgi:hypothetical protein